MIFLLSNPQVSLRKWSLWLSVSMGAGSRMLNMLERHNLVEPMPGSHGECRYGIGDRLAGASILGFRVQG